MYYRYLKLACVLDIVAFVLLINLVWLGPEWAQKMAITIMCFNVICTRGVYLKQN